MATARTSSILFHLATIVFLFPFGLVVIFGLLLAAALYTYRTIHKLAAKVVRPDLDEILPPLENLFAHDELHSPTGNICVTLIFDGKVPVECFQDAFTEKILLARKPNGQLEYAELRKCWSHFGSYMFWKKDLAFNVQNHIHNWNKFLEEANISNADLDGKCSEMNLQRIFTRLQVAPWEPGQSPWEWIIIPNYVPDNCAEKDAPPKTATIFRIHHTLGDGLTTQKLLLKMTTSKINTILRDRNIIRLTRSQKLKATFSTFYQTAFELLEFLLQFKLDRHDWMGRTNQPKFMYTTTWTKNIPVESVRIIKSKHGVTFNTVIFSTILSAFQKTALAAGLNPPSGITTFIPIPLPNHPGGLKVYTSAAFIKFPLTSQNPVDRLKRVDQVLEGTGRMLPAFNYAAINLYSMLPSIILRQTKIVGTTVGITCIPGPQEPCSLREYPLTQVFSNFPLGPHDIDNRGGCTVTAFSSFGQLKITLTSATTRWPFPPAVQAEYFDQYVHEEISALLRNDKDDS